MAPLQISDSIGQYLIREKINSGGMGTVFRARHRGMKQDVALKVMLPELATDADYRARFTREAMTLTMLQHPNIVRILDANLEGEVAYYAMELLSEQSLRDELAYLSSSGAKMDVPRALSIARQLAVALDYAHTMGFVHRDIKPSNVLRNSHGSYVLGDFGIVAAREALTRLTKSQAMIGTPEDMSPEQAQGNAVDGRSDIYALGALLYEMLAGAPPFEGDTPLAVMFKHVREAPPALRSRRPDAAPAVIALVEKCLAKQPGARFQTAAQLVAALDDAAQPASQRWPLAPLLAASGVGGIAAGGALLWSLWSSGGLTQGTVPAAKTQPSTTDDTPAAAFASISATAAPAMPDEDVVELTPGQAQSLDNINRPTALGFTARAGDAIVISVTVTTPPGSGVTGIDLYGPSGARLRTFPTSGGQTKRQIEPFLPDSGRYTLRISPGAEGASSVVVWVGAIPSAEIVANAAPLDVRLMPDLPSTVIYLSAQRGERLTFGTVVQDDVAVKVLAAPDLVLLDPHGAVVELTRLMSSRIGASVTAPLPESGQYRLLLSAARPTALNHGLTVTRIVPQRLKLDGPVANGELTRAGERHSYEVALSIGQRVTISHTETVPGPMGLPRLNVQVVDPSGRQQTLASGATLEASSDGIYTIYLDAPGYEPLPYSLRVSTGP